MPGRLETLEHSLCHPNLIWSWCFCPQILRYFDIGFTSVFTVEIVLKVSPSAPWSWPCTWPSTWVYTVLAKGTPTLDT